MEKDARQLYFDLIKKSLSFSLWEDPGMPIEMFAYRKAALPRKATLWLAKLLRSSRYQLVKLPAGSEADRAAGKVWPRFGESMIGHKRMDNVQKCVESVLRDDVPGDLIETGVWRGGAVILMKAVLEAYGIDDRRVFVADSFEGLPEPDEEKYPLDKGDIHYTEDFLAVSEGTVRSNFAKYGLLDDKVVFLKGWFKDTLPEAPIDKLAVLRIDGDMYESTTDAITSLYPRLSEGGFCIIDDYGHGPCQEAVEDYRRQHNITSPIEQIDYTGVFWRK